MVVTVMLVISTFCTVVIDIPFQETDEFAVPDVLV